MDTRTAEVMQACAAGALNGTLTFPQIVGQLAALGVERYHADYSRQEITYYLTDGDSLVVELPHPRLPTAEAFSAHEVAAAVGRSQRGEHTYPDFVRQTMAAGCVGYFVLIAGRQVQYFGRRGETHVEHFPPGP